MDTNVNININYKINMKGKLISIVNECYKRNDIDCGINKCEICVENDKFIKIDESDTNKNVFVFDYDSFINNLDILYNFDFLENIIISYTTCKILFKENKNIYEKLKDLYEKKKNFFIFPNEYSNYTQIKKDYSNLYENEDLKYEFEFLNWYSKHFELNNNVNLVLICENYSLKEELKLNSLEHYSFKNYIKDNYKEYFLEFSDYFIIQEDEIIDDLLYKEYEEFLSLKELKEKIRKGELFTGKLNIDRKNSSLGFINCKILKKDIFIEGIDNLNRSYNGDIVAVELLPLIENKTNYLFQNDEVIEDETENFNLEKIEIDNLNLKLIDEFVEKGNFLKGKIKGIIKRNLRNITGQILKEKFMSNEKNSVLTLIEPTDQRYPKILLKTNNHEKLLDNYIVFSIDNWFINVKYPCGHFIKNLGKNSDVSVINDVILFENMIETKEFSKSVLNCLPKEGKNFKIPNEEFSKRIDLRDKPICSVDPPGCKDIDDALHCIKLNDNVYEIGVHIADVTYFVKGDTPIDIEAQKRCTTVYMVDKRTDMLPKLLTEDLCSLKCKTDKLAFSCIWKIEVDFKNEEFKILETNYSKSIIYSKESLTYEQAQNIIDKKVNSNLYDSLNNLNKISKVLKKNRLKNGALELASTQVKFEMDEFNNPTDVSFYKSFETNTMVEEFMLLANISVGKKIYSHFNNKSILRKHNSPKPEAIKKLKGILEDFGYDIDYNSSKNLANSLNKIKRKNDPFFNKLIRILTTRCMHEAVYFNSVEFDYPEYYHYGLACEIYTHFTSPIRRYADVLVHRLLSASIGHERITDFMCSQSNMNTICNKLNFKNRNARNTSKSSSDFHSYLFFKNKKIVEEGIITEILKTGFSMIIPKFGFEGFIEFDEDLIKNSEKYINKNKGYIKEIDFQNKRIILFNWYKFNLEIKMVGLKKKIDFKLI